MTARSPLRAALLFSASLLAGCGAGEGPFLGGSAAAPYAVTAQSPALLSPVVVPSPSSASAAGPRHDPAPAPRLLAAASAPGFSAAPPRRANAEMAQDLVDLAFRNEAGESRASFARWEGPARIRLAAAFAEDAAFLDSLLAELAQATGLEIRRAEALEPAEIRIRAVRPARFAAAAPGALCGSQHEGDWRSLAAFRGGIVDIPADASPARRRICLVEEVAQLLGPVNDLERVADTIFNDDGAHAALTGFDRLILKTLYAPEIRPGMGPAEVRAGAIAAMARLNPAGIHGGAPSAPESAEWSSAYRTALGAFGRDASGFAAALRRLDAAAALLPPGDHRRAKTLTTRAAAALAQGESAAAARDAEAARGLAQAAGDEAREAEALGLMARAAQARGDAAAAGRWAAEAQGRALRLQRWDLEESLAGLGAARPAGPSLAQASPAPTSASASTSGRVPAFRAAP